MSVTQADTSIDHDGLRASHASHTADRRFRRLARFSALLPVLIAALFVLALSKEAVREVAEHGLGFAWTEDWDPSSDAFGARAFIHGTLLTSAIGLLIAVPIGVGAAIYIAEYSPERLRSKLTFIVEMVAIVPSVVYGLWGVFVLVPWLRDSGEPWLGAHVDVFGWFSGPARGFGILAAGLVLAIMLLPTVTALATRSVAKVPQALRDGALALGATRSDTLRHVVLPHARAGVASGVVLALGRALGETMAVTMVIGQSPTAPDSLFDPGYSMASVLAVEFADATSPAHRSALAFLALLLFSLTLVVGRFAVRIVEDDRARKRGRT